MITHLREKSRRESRFGDRSYKKDGSVEGDRGSGNVKVSRAHCSTLLGLGKVETVKIHDLVPRCYEITDKYFLRIITPVDLRNGSELGT